MVEGEELETIARRDIDSNQFMSIGTADEEGVPWVSPVWYARAKTTNPLDDMFDGRMNRVSIEIAQERERGGGVAPFCRARA